MSQLSIVSIYVSHFSEKYIRKFGDRHKAELGENVFLINSSVNSIDEEEFYDFNVINVGENIGFSAANNMGIQHARYLKSDYFLFINPDILLPPLWLRRVLDTIEYLQCQNVGIFTVPLLGYDFENDNATGMVDSLGVNHTWYGRWFDISQGADVHVLDKKTDPYVVSAVCGALMIIHKDTIDKLLKKDMHVFNESYFMYKEDIELSIRVRRLGKKIMMIPSLPVFHCRGWEKNRRSAPYWAKKLSARNELKMHLKYYWRFLPYSIMKYLYVSVFERFVSK